MLKSRKSLIVMGLSFLSVLSVFRASLSAEKPSPTPDVPIVMHDFLGEMLRLQPYMVSPEKFSDSKNEAFISARLVKLAELSRRLDHSKRLESASFRISAVTLQNHLQELNEVFHHGKKAFARQMLNAVLDGCSSCHTQVPTQKMIWTYKPSELQGSQFDRAEFEFATRHYDEALENYNETIEHPRGIDPTKLGTALKRKLYVFLRVKQDPQAALKNLQADERFLKNHPALKKDVAGWKEAVRKIAEIKLPKNAQASDIEAFASQSLQPLMSGNEEFKPSSFVTYVNVSGIISNFINTHPEESLTPGLLYWLGVSSNRLSHSLFFSLASDYLKECIRRFPDSPEAKKCYSEWESNTLDEFTGSSGVHLPKEVKEELAKYKKMIPAK